MYRHVLPFFLLFALINTILFPSVLLVSGKTKFRSEVRASTEATTSLTEYILEDYLLIHDVTPDDQEEDVYEFEELLDEIDILTYTAASMKFLQYLEEKQIYITGHYPLFCSCFSSSNPPPELA